MLRKIRDDWHTRGNEKKRSSGVGDTSGGTQDRGLRSAIGNCLVDSNVVACRGSRGDRTT